MPAKLRWGRIILGGLFIELAMFAVILPLYAVGEMVVYYSVPPLAIVTAFLFGWWTAKGANGRFLLHGALAAVAASVMYVALSVASGQAAEIPLLFHLSHGLRLMGGIAGGMWAARRAGAVTTSPARV